MTEEHSIFCNNSGHKMERFLEVCLLVLLYNESGYGYGLIEQLGYFGFSEDELNVSSLYRTLRRMEKANSVTSVWKEGGPGPKKRVYEITESGKTELETRIQILKVRKNRIERLISRFSEIVQRENQSRETKKTRNGEENGYI